MLRAHLVELTGKAPISVSEYVRLCLYHPEWGYYVKNIPRVGRDGDFYTASSLKGGVFASLLLEAARNLLPDAGGADFGVVEIGAEPGRALFENSRVFRFGDAISLSGGILLFSNELLDAQPFDRFRFENGKVSKAFVSFAADGSHSLHYSDPDDGEMRVLEKYAGLGRDLFFLDFSFDALRLFREICSMDWRGALVFADYFRTRAELADFGNGTARIYRGHRAGRGIFDCPGDADITFSPPFEDFVETMLDCGFGGVSCETQAKFLMENARGGIRRIVESGGVFSDEKRALSELLSPAYFGENFRVLCGAR